MKQLNRTLLNLRHKKTLLAVIPVVLLISLVGFVNITRASGTTTTPPIVFGQTLGWVKGELAVFTYGQNYICTGDTTGLSDGTLGVGPGPENFPCAVLNPGVATSPLNLPGIQLDPTDIPKLIVIVPFFTIGGVNQAFADPNIPGQLQVFVQCPERTFGASGLGAFGHCIFHDTHLRLPPALGGTQIQLPNHTHIVNDDIGGTDQPWIVQVVLVFNQNIWPTANGHCGGEQLSPTKPCLTSFKAIFSPSLTHGLPGSGADILGPVDSNLILFFGVEVP